MTFEEKTAGTFERRFFARREEGDIELRDNIRRSTSQGRPGMTHRYGDVATLRDQAICSFPDIPSQITGINLAL